jgi:hypothetical protein
MAATAISYGTKEWLAELVSAGWEASVVKRLPVDITAENPDVGVMVTNDEGAGVFVPCPCEHDAIELLEAALGDET